MQKAIDILENNKKEIDDKFLMGCHVNNIACSRWWLNIPNILNEMNNSRVNDSNNIDLFKKLALESVMIIKMFKTAIIEIENLDVCVEDNYNYIEEKKKNIEEENKSKEKEGIIYYIFTYKFFILFRSKKFK